MSNSLLPTQIGYVPASQDGTQQSQLVLGRNTTGTWEAVGFGAQSRPDPLQALQVFVTVNPLSQTPTVPVTINIDATNALAVALANPNAPSVFTFTLQEVATCETDANGVTSEKRRMALISQAYPKAS